MNTFIKVYLAQSLEAAGFAAIFPPIRLITEIPTCICAGLIPDDDPNQRIKDMLIFRHCGDLFGGDTKVVVEISMGFEPCRGRTDFEKTVCDRITTFFNRAEPLSNLTGSDIHFSYPSRIC